MENLLKAKEEELEALKKVKNALAKKMKQFKSEITEISKENEELKLKNTDLKLKNTELNKETEKKLKFENDEKSKLHKKVEEIKKEKHAIQKKLDEKIEEANKIPLTPEKLMEQLKNGMFSLGKQNKTILNKVENILQKIKEVPNNKIKKSITGQNYTSPGLSQSNFEESDDKLKSNKKKFKSRKPSDILKGNIDNNEPVKKESPEKGEKKDFRDQKQPKKQFKAPSAKSSLQIIKYPSDGSIKCPKCGKQEFKEQENKKKVLSYSPLKYGKKYYCKNCRTEWAY